ncbi:sporulation membrane protein YtrI [Bacillus suaedae]|uniref:Sporulation membrane protein YtrI C-terminal domain-containing protein n=1 Tax=Halalkalibacter suaedae TaxID=2822140 RepID=A0A941AP40_9BACI|nr:sporulation membrane protein YtrI [Bacillus suaedae]MBP3949753.1 hypothetical protein [Bacillus suaedae]
MRIPPFYERKTFQRFFAGCILGVLLGWTFFIYQYGQVYNELVLRLSEQQAIIENLEERIEELNSEQSKLNEENQKKLTIQEIEIEFNNDRRLRLNQLTLLELRKQVLEEIQHIERKDLESVANTKDLLISTLENKVFVIDQNRFQVKVDGIFLYTKTQIQLTIIPSST